MGRGPSSGKGDGVNSPPWSNPGSLPHGFRGLGQPAAHFRNQDNHQPQFAQDSPRSREVAGMGINIAFFHFQESHFGQ